METEAHVYALAISASTLLAFYPFLIVMLSFCRDVLRWPAAQQAIYLALGDFFAGEPGEFLVRNLQPWLVPQSAPRRRCSCCCSPPTAFSSRWKWRSTAHGASTQNRSYVKNQLVSLGLIFACGGLALAFADAHGAEQPLDRGRRRAVITQSEPGSIFCCSNWPLCPFPSWLSSWSTGFCRIARSNRRRVAPVAILVGLALEALKYVNLLISPMLTEKLKNEY